MNIVGIMLITGLISFGGFKGCSSVNNNETYTVGRCYTEKYSDYAHFIVKEEKDGEFLSAQYNKMETVPGLYGLDTRSFRDRKETPCPSFTVPTPILEKIKYYNLETEFFSAIIKSKEKSL